MVRKEREENREKEREEKRRERKREKEREEKREKENEREEKRRELSAGRERGRGSGERENKGTRGETPRVCVKWIRRKENESKSEIQKMSNFSSEAAPSRKRPWKEKISAFGFGL